MSLWAFRFLLWYVCILLVQPQNRFLFLWPLKIADWSFIAAICLHVMACLEARRPLIRMGPGTILAFTLVFFATLSQHFGAYQISPAWNAWIDIIVKNALLLIMIEALASSIERVWAVQMTVLIATLWWVKAGLQLSRAGAVYAGDRIMGAAVGLIENPNGFAYMMCIMLPLYFYAYRQATKWWIRYIFLGCIFAAIWIVFETGSRTGLVTLIAVGAFLLPHYGHRKWKTVLLVGLAIIFLYPLTGEKNRVRFRTIPESIASFLGLKEEDEEQRDMTQDEQSADERRQKNKDTWALIKENLIFGVGTNPDENRFKKRFPMAAGQVHCEILMAGKQMGLIGMGIYVGLVGTIFIGGWSVRRQSKEWPALAELGWTLQAQAVAIAIGGYFCPIPWTPVHFLLAGVASALVMRTRDELAGRGSFAAGF